MISPNHRQMAESRLSLPVLLWLIAIVGIMGAENNQLGEGLFLHPVVHRVRLQIAPSDLESLRRDPRNYVSATVQVGTNRYEQVGIHLKGSTGSFRSIDDKPALTLNFPQFKPEQTIHGLSKIHLNNSVEDPSYLNERVGSELFRAALLPAPRVAWAAVELNDRGLGLYVLKEGFTEEFLRLYFHDPTGNLYDTGPGFDVQARLQRDLGIGPDNQSDLQRLATAAQEPNLANRWLRLNETLDLDRFISFMAMEMMTGHRDGYCLARNNFRLYHDPGSDRFVFLPHGMDQLFGRPDLPWRPHMAGLVAHAVLETPEGRRQYRARFGMLLTNVFRVHQLTNRVTELTALIRPALPRSARREFDEAVASVKEQIALRHASLIAQISAPEPVPLRFKNGAAQLTDWRADGVQTWENASDTLTNGEPLLKLRAGEKPVTAWTTATLLESGRYRFEGSARVTGVVSLSYGKNHGASLRVMGKPSSRPRDFTGDSDWQRLEVEFQIDGAVEEVTLVCELRARRGEASFDLKSLRLVRLE